MDRRIPSSIKIEVIKQWLNGVSRDDIAGNNDISFGSVSNIIQDARNKEFPDIDLLRGLASALEEKGWDLYQFTPSMRLYSRFRELGMSEEKIENFLEHLSVFLYKNDVADVKEFLLQLESVSDMAKNLDLSIYDIKGDIIDKQAELGKLNKELLLVKRQVEQKKFEFNILVKKYKVLSPSTPGWGLGLI